MAELVSYQRSFEKPTSANLPASPLRTYGPTPPRTVPVVEELTPTLMQHNQQQLKQLLSKCRNGVWLSKIPELYLKAFKEDMHPAAVKDLVNWTDICCVEKPGTSQIVDRLVYPAINMPVKPVSVVPPHPLGISPQKSTPAPTQTSPIPPITKPCAPQAKPSPTQASPMPPLTKPCAPQASTCPTQTSPMPPLTKSFAPQARPCATQTNPIPPITKPCAPQARPSPTQARPSPTQTSPIPPLTKPCAPQASTCPTQTSPMPPLTKSFAPKARPCATQTSSIPPLTKPRAPQTSPMPPQTRPHTPPTSPIPPQTSTPQPKPCPPLRKPLTPSQKAPPLPTPPHSPVIISADDKQKLRVLLEKHSGGLWADSLPTLFQKTFESTLPSQVMEDLSVLSDSCVVEYPTPTKDKAILYPIAIMEDDIPQTPVVLPHQRIATPLAPPLSPPDEDNLSVLVVEALSTNSLVIRYVGPGYSEALADMEDSMKKFYDDKLQSGAPCVLLPKNLYAVLKEEGGVLRAQLCEVMDKNVKVYFVDYGFSGVVGKAKVKRLDEQFLRLPFQISTCKLAGLSDFHTKSAVLKVLESKACSHILSAEVVERGEVPVVVLYDTSQTGHVNINAMCLQALQDTSLFNPLTVNSVYLNVAVTRVCPDGTLFCQVPCCGLSRLKCLSEKIESKVSKENTELRVTKPFQGKICLACFEGKWSRVEVTKTHSACMVDIRFVDLGHEASVKVTELREIPPVLLPEAIVIPFQALRCALEELTDQPAWTAECYLWLCHNVVNMADCSMKITKMAKNKPVQIYLNSSKGCHELRDSINHQLLNFARGDDSALQLKRSASRLASGDATPLPVAMDKSALPLMLPLPNVGQTADVFVPVACHPGHFVVQLREDLSNLTTMMGEMVAHYNSVQSDEAVTVEKNLICAAMVEMGWYRVLIKGVLTQELVRVYELDYGSHHLVSSKHLRPLVDKFRQLPFQAIIAELADVKLPSWSEDVVMMFRHHVERRTLTALIKSVQDAPVPWERKITVHLRENSVDRGDFWVHNVMIDLVSELGKAE